VVDGVEAISIDRDQFIPHLQPRELGRTVALDAT